MKLKPKKDQIQIPNRGNRPIQVNLPEKKYNKMGIYIYL